MTYEEPCPRMIYSYVVDMLILCMKLAWAWRTEKRNWPCELGVFMTMSRFASL